MILLILPKYSMSNANVSVWPAWNGLGLSSDFFSGILSFKVKIMLNKTLFIYGIKLPVITFFDPISWI